MNNIKFLLGLMVFFSISAMDNEAYKWQNPMINSDTGQGYCVGLPNDIKVYIITTVAKFCNLYAIRTLGILNKDFNTIINSQDTTKKIINIFVSKSHNHHEEITLGLKTQGAKEYIAIQKKLRPEWNNVKTVQDAESLINAGADIDFIDSFRNTLLGTVILFLGDYYSQQAVSIISYLISMGASIDVIDSEKQTLLYLAADKNDTSVVNVLLKNGFNKELINMTNLLKNTALSRASFYENVEMITLLLNAGADPLIPDMLGVSLLNRARIKVELNSKNIKAKEILDLFSKQALKNQQVKKQ